MAKRKPPKRRCKGKTRAGERCKAPPPKGAGYCRAHDPSLPDEARFGSRAQAAEAGRIGGPATRQPRPIELLRARIEAAIDKWIDPYEQAVEGAMVTATHEGEVHVSEVRDLGARIKAAEAAFDRAYGKPRQTTEVTGGDGGPIEIGGDGPETTRLVHDFLAALAGED